MTILSSIRSRIGLIVGIIFVALLSFVLTDFIGGRSSMFGNSQGPVGEINGNSISYGDFQTRMQRMIGDADPDPQMQEQYVAGVWDELETEFIFQPQWEKAGVTITSEELSEQMMGDKPSMFMNQFFQDRQTGQINPQFANPDGTLSGAAIRGAVKQFTPEQEAQWVRVEKEIGKQLIKEKYNTLLRKGIYITSAQAEQEFAEENTRFDVKYFSLKYAAIPDSTIDVSDAEIQEYYKANQTKFRQVKSTRDMEFIGYDLFPSADDIAEQRKQMDSLASKFGRIKTATDDSMFAITESENGTYNKSWMGSGQFPVGADSLFLNAEAGKVFGPYNSGENVVVYKVLNHRTAADSVKVRHILVTYKGAAQAPPDLARTKDQAKLRADSILRVVKSGKTKMEDIVDKLTDDPGSKQGNKGDYGWFTAESGFVQPFKDAGFNNDKGVTVVTETDFGYHVIQVLDKTAPAKKAQVLTIEKKTEPSDKTVQDLYNKASAFAGTNNKGDLFTKAAQKDGLNMMKAPDISEDAKQITGLTEPRQIIRWMYNEDTEVGSVSEPFLSGNRYVVCHLTKILDKGFKPVSEQSVRDICMLEIRKQKKAQRYIDQLNKQKGATIDVWAANAKEAVAPAQGLTFTQPYIQGAAYENEVMGVVSKMTAGKLSAPLKGAMGVYVVYVEKVTPAGKLTDVAGQRNKAINTIVGRVETAASDVLREEAKVEDNRARFF